MDIDITPQTEAALLPAAAEEEKEEAAPAPSDGVPVIGAPASGVPANGVPACGWEIYRQKKLLGTVLMLSAAFLCGVSLMLHASAAKELFTRLSSEGRQVLLSVSMPGVSVERAAPRDDIAEDGDAKKDSTDTEQGDSTADIQYKNADLSTSAGGAMDISNETDYDPDLSALSAAARPVAAVSAVSDEIGEPLVLIYHTHGTEAYAECAADSFRSSDTKKNVVAIGDTIVSTLAEAGIKSIHIDKMFDMENWSAAYDTSTAAVRRVLDEHPSIQYIFDVHRDCIGNDEAGYVRSLSRYGETDTAQLMFVCGTDQGGSRHTTWQKNLTVALQLQRRLWETSSTLMRPIDLRCASFYQDTGDGALLCEFGTCANTLAEAKRSAVLFASSLADYIYGSDCGLDRDELIAKYGE